MIDVNVFIKELDIDCHLFSLCVAKSNIKEVNDAFYCEREYNGTDVNLETCKFIYK